MNDLGSYRDLILPFKELGYQFVTFPELAAPSGQIALRHDVKFDTGAAVKIAEIEAELGVRATYFFGLRFNFYNLLSKQNLDNVRRVMELGHETSIHFDPTIYDDFRAGLAMEAGLWQAIFGQSVKMVSLHRPSPYFQELDEPIAGIDHVYQRKYFRDVKYFSDSRGEWRFGHSHDSAEFKAGASIHLLTHPIWWIIDGANANEKFQAYVDRDQARMIYDVAANVIPFRSAHPDWERGRY